MNDFNRIQMILPNPRKQVISRDIGVNGQRWPVPISVMDHEQAYRSLRLLAWAYWFDGDYRSAHRNWKMARQHKQLWRAEQYEHMVKDDQEAQNVDRW